MFLTPTRLFNANEFFSGPTGACQVQPDFFLRLNGSFSSLSKASQVHRKLLLLVLLLSLLLLLLLLSSPAAFAFLPSLQKVSASQRAAQVGMHFLTLLYMLACCNLRVPVSCLMAMRRPQPLLPLQPYDSVSPCCFRVLRSHPENAPSKASQGTRSTTSHVLYMRVCCIFAISHSESL